MKKKIVIYCILFFFMQFFKSYLITDYIQDYGKGRIEIILGKIAPLSYNEMKFNDEYNTYHPILSNYIKNVENDTDKLIAVIGTTANCEQLEHLQIIDGAFFGEEAVDEERNIALISDQLSIAMFGSEKAAGNLIHLGEETYEIIGVYKKGHKVRDAMMDDGYEDIYVPITSTVAKETNIQFVTIDNTYLDEIPQQEDLQRMGLGQDALNKNDQSDWAKRYRSKSQVPMILLWILFILIGGGRIYMLKGTSKQYICENYRRLILMFIFYLVGACILFYFAFKGIYIRKDALPQENIFDLVFYWAHIKAEWVRHNQFIVNGSSHFEQALYLLKYIVYCLNIIQCVGLIHMTGLLRSKFSDK